MVAFTRDQLRAFAPAARADVLDALVDGADEIRDARIVTPNRLHHFLAQVATETGGLRLLEENLNYSADRLLQVFPKYFKSRAAAAAVAYKPEKIANIVYGKRLGNTKPGDGFAFRGSGMLQTTGRSNFRLAGAEDNPEGLRQPGPALTSALKFWTDNNCNSFADRDDLVGLRRRINGGSHGLAEARNYLVKAKRVFTGAADAPAAPDLPAAKVRELQAQLVALGYVSVGKPDGQIGPMTIGAISAFQAENGLDVTGRFDAQTQGHLYEAAPREVVRATEEPENSRIVSGARTLKKGAVGLLGIGTIDQIDDPIAALTGVQEKFEKLKSLLNPFQGATDWLTQNWMLVVIALAVGVYVYSRRIERARLDDHLSGASA